MSKSKPDNESIARALERAAELLERQDENPIKFEAIETGPPGVDPAATGARSLTGQ